MTAHERERFGLGPYRRAAGLAVLGAALALAACNTPEVVDPSTEDAVLHLVLGRRVMSRTTEREGQHALLVRSGSPAEPARYIEADRFEMRRVSDGAEFDWHHRALWDEVGGFPGTVMRDANYYLPDTTTSAGLGADGLTAGETYDLRIEIGDDVVEGRTTIPAGFELTVVEEDDGRAVAWPRVDGSAAYIVAVGSSAREPLQLDTVFRVPDDADPDTRISVRAIDDNLYRYMTDDQSPRSGITGGLGVFGAITEAEVSL